jgi:F420-dependent oxidoreductase-like protein
MATFRRGMHFGSYGEVDDGEAVVERLLAAVLAAEAAGFDVVSVPDHVHQNQVAGGPQAPMFEAYTLLGALAMRSASASLMSLVTPVTLRSPGLLAKAVITLDALSGGRAVLGIGAGWDAAESQAYGVPFPSIGERMDRTEEAVSVCRALFQNPQASFQGDYYSLREAYSVPRPIADIPVMVAGGGERRTLRIAARHADACNVFGDADTVRHKFDVLDRHCREAGRDPAEIARTVFLTDAGDPEKLRPQLQALADAGADGAFVMGTFDLERIAALGRVLGEVFPD